MKSWCFWTKIYRAKRYVTRGLKSWLKGGRVKSLNFDLRTIQVGITDAIVEQDFINELSQQSGVSGANVNEVVTPDQAFVTSNDQGYRQRRTKLVDTQSLLVPPPSPVSFAGDFWINQIDAPSAWAALSDPGVRLVPNAIGIIDTGVPSSQDVLNSSRISRYSEEGVSMSGDDTSHPHGYNVTGYAAGYGNGPDRRGVNPHSDVVFVDVLDPTGNVYNTTLMLGIKTAIDKSAGVVNTDCMGEPVASSPAGLLNLGSAIQSSLVADGIGLNITGDVHLDRGQMANVSINVTVPAGGVHAIDVGFVIDQSGSYEDDIQTLQNRATDIVNNFKARTDVDVQFGVVGFADFPQPPYGGTGDVPYRLYQSITDDQNALVAAIDKLNKPLMWGNDDPESQYEALFRTAREIGWRDGALRILLLATDEDFHNSDTEPSYPGTGRIAALATLEAKNVIVIGLQSGDNSAAAQRLQELADATGGSMLSLDAASSQIVDAIVRGVDAALAKVDITLDVLAGQSWVTGITPTVHQDIRPGATVSFTVSLQGQRDPSIEDLPYNVYLWARGDGSALLSRTKIPIIVPKE